MGCAGEVVGDRGGDLIEAAAGLRGRLAVIEVPFDAYLRPGGVIDINNEMSVVGELLRQDGAGALVGVRALPVGWFDPSRDHHLSV